jgi:Flp pilus assembly protein TadD
VLNPNYAVGWAISGYLQACIGQQDVAVEHLARAIRLSPMDPAMHTFQNMTGMAHMFAGRYAEAASWVRKALVSNPTFLSALRNLTVSLALEGRVDEAHKVLVRMLEVDPGRRISTLNQVLPPHFKPQDYYAKFVDGLRLAGLPE